MKATLIHFGPQRRLELERYVQAADSALALLRALVAMSALPADQHHQLNHSVSSSRAGPCNVRSHGWWNCDFR